MAPHSSTLAWKTPWTEELGGLQSMGSRRVGHDWATSLSLSCIGEGNGNPLQCSCLENPRDGGAWWAAVSGVAQSRIRLKRLSSSSSILQLVAYLCVTTLRYWCKPKHRWKKLQSESSWLKCFFFFLIYWYVFYLFRDSLVAQIVKKLPAMQETWVRSLGLEDPLEKGVATHSSILAWRIPCTEELGGLRSMGLQRVGHDWVTNI